MVRGALDGMATEAIDALPRGRPTTRCWSGSPTGPLGRSASTAFTHWWSAPPGASWLTVPQPGSRAAPLAARGAGGAAEDGVPARARRRRVGAHRSGDAPSRTSGRRCRQVACRRLRPGGDLGGALRRRRMHRAAELRVSLTSRSSCSIASGDADEAARRLEAQRALPPVAHRPRRRRTGAYPTARPRQDAASPAPEMNADRLGPESRGVFVISATPFHEDGALDLASLDRALEFYLLAGVHGITLLGMMGEGAQTHERRERNRPQAGTLALCRARPGRGRCERRVAGVDATPRRGGRWMVGRRGSWRRPRLDCAPTTPSSATWPPSPTAWPDVPIAFRTIPQPLAMTRPAASCRVDASGSGIVLKDDGHVGPSASATVAM